MVRTIVTGSSHVTDICWSRNAHPDILVFMAFSKFAPDVHASSSVVPVQLDITDGASTNAAHAFVANHIKQKEGQGLNVLINNAAVGILTF
ncbi:hypothetical protein B0H16DRAFT_1903023 [Mycena metata]|uniref:Uncharacterized protein n=1 Tax=Mycena metata TaxID=1033252 RepID=A0AAD7DXI3_9AGAR|nr:hypothetical protein B0H16DRAFT_1903023 [Mycena metata]